jgi:hypothetical protein
MSASRTAPAHGNYVKGSGLAGPPFGESLEPYLAPYGYHAVNEGKLGVAFGQDCDLIATIKRKSENCPPTDSLPLTRTGPLLTSRLRAGRPTSCGIIRDRAILRTEAEHDPGHLGETLRLSLTPDGGFASIGGSGGGNLPHAHRLFDIVI